MPTLLRLPREIRDEIVQLILLFPLGPPPNARRYRRKDVDDYPRLADYRDSVFQPEHSPTVPLLQVNKQLRAETFDAIIRHKLVSTIDIADVDRCWIWPTWRLILPRRKQVIEQLDVNLLFADSQYTSELQPNSLRVGDTIWAFISRLLTVGPLGPLESARTDCNIVVRKLVIRRKPIRPPHCEIPEREIPVRMIDGMAHLNHDRLTSIEHENWGCRGIEEGIPHRRIMNRVNTIRTLEQLLERVGVICFCRVGLPPLPDVDPTTWLEGNVNHITDDVDNFRLEKLEIRQRNGL
jgi:hypothetical protein